MRCASEAWPPSFSPMTSVLRFDLAENIAVERPAGPFPIIIVSYIIFFNFFLLFLVCVSLCIFLA